ncbi:MAG: homoserine O-acetyltransferase [Bacteroidetes bacterium]|nr:homoserine O-acetyltransferase [Bacteroidota bacterium]
MSDLRTHLFDSVELESGRVLQNVQVAYQTWGRLNAERTNVVVVFHSMTGDSNAASWWGSILGPGRAICTRTQFVVCANLLGSCYGTTGPSSINPSTGVAYGSDFPVCTVRDQVQVQRRLLSSLGVCGVECVIGGSLGGFMALEWAVLDPTVKKVVAVTTSGRHSAWCIAWTETQRQAIYADPNWNGGHYSADAPPKAGLAGARMIAMLSYRNPASFTTRFGREKILADSSAINQNSGENAPEEPFSVESYLRYQGQKLVDRFDANSYVRLTQTSNSHDLSRGRGSYLEVLRSIKAQVLVVGVDTDILFPLEEQRELAEAIPGADLAIIESPHGHDAFLLEGDTLNGIIKKWFSGPRKIIAQPVFQQVTCA